jgi:hypothetical protein
MPTFLMNYIQKDDKKVIIFLHIHQKECGKSLAYNHAFDR